jgi:hypothetical protein
VPEEVADESFRTLLHALISELIAARRLYWLQILISDLGTCSSISLARCDQTSPLMAIKIYS